jgi:lipid A 3-O-deacylase
MPHIDHVRRASPLAFSRALAALAFLFLAASRQVQGQGLPLDRDSAGVAGAGLTTAPTPPGILSEVRVGVLAHDLPVLGPQREHGADINTELLFVSPVSEQAVAHIAPAARWLFRPRPELGVTGNLSGYTSQVYVGFDWTAPAVRSLIRSQDRLLFDIGFGGAVNNDPTLASVINRAHLGSNLLFHPNLQIGYGIGSHYTVALYYEHSSNAHLAKVNEGLNNIGFRLGRQL